MIPSIVAREFPCDCNRVVAYGDCHFNACATHRHGAATRACQAVMDAANANMAGLRAWLVDHECKNNRCPFCRVIERIDATLQGGTTTPTKGTP